MSVPVMVGFAAAAVLLGTPVLAQRMLRTRVPSRPRIRSSGSRALLTAPPVSLLANLSNATE